MIRIRIAPACLLLAAFTFAQKPSPKPAPPSTPPPPAPVPVHGQGCVADGDHTGCLVLRDSGSGVLYNLLISGARPHAGEGIDFTGSPHEAPTSCMQGVPVNVSSWSQTDSVKCSSDTSAAPGKTPAQTRSTVSAPKRRAGN